jgi:hypothetical protein
VRKYRPRESSIRSLGRKPTNRFSEYRHVTRSGRRSMPRLFVCCVLLCLGTLTSAQNTASALAQTPSTPVQVVYLTEGTTIVTYNVDPQTLSPCSCTWCACLHWVCCPRQPLATPEVGFVSSENTGMDSSDSRSHCHKRLLSMDFASPSCLDLYPPVLHNFRAWARGLLAASEKHSAPLPS